MKINMRTTKTIKLILRDIFYIVALTYLILQNISLKEKLDVLDNDISIIRSDLASETKFMDSIIENLMTE